jgi:HK97 family phage portal protein
MGYFAKLLSRGAIVPNANGPLGYDPGDPNGLEFDAPPQTEQRTLSTMLPTPWDGWPTGWGTNWQIDSGINTLVDVAWACLDLNSSIISSMPVYRLREGIMPPTQWMINPDPDIYSSWQEFAKQLFWDFQMGEAFVLPFAHGSDGYPSRFRVIPPFLVSVEIRDGRRLYYFAKSDVTDEILHLRYKSTTIAPRGMGPLEAAGARMVAIGLLQRYADELAKTGGVPLYWLELERRITEGEGKDLLDRWIESRIKNAGQPALVSNGAKLNQAKSMSAKDMALMELSQFHESRIAVLLGVPPFLVGLAGATGSLTYSNISDLFDFHDRSSLRPKVRMVMEGLSAWSLPNGQTVELNRDDYTRLPADQRVAVYQKYIEMGVLTPEDVKTMERFYGAATNTAAQALTGGTQ